jgi:hypothetical protein
MEFERVFYKNNFASGIGIFSVYMIYGGTNWGNLGFAGTLKHIKSYPNRD